MKTILKAFLILVATALPIGAFANSDNVGTLKKVEAQYVCMVNNTLFNKTQIPTVVEGKTYYGCCSMCKEKLERSTALRMAIDPISKNKVDKATAIIGAQADGKVHYFENEENLKKFGHNKHSGSKHDAKQCIQGEDCPMHEDMKHPGKDGDMKKMHENMGEMKGMMHNKKDDHGDHKH